MLVGTDLETRNGPLLSDGTPLRDLIDFERREVSIRVLNDPEIHRIELDRIFARSWIALAHESEVPNPGDYVLRSIGEDGVIITRDANGKVNALLNVCTHRGMEVCWGSVGNSTTFRCGYHGWIFDNEGNLRGVPLEQEMYGDWDKSEYGLQRARVEISHGLIYANFDDDAMPLDEYLGDMTFYHELMFGGTEWEPLGPPWRLDIAVNWKAAADQNSGDAYHFAGAHRPFVEMGLVPEAGLAGMCDIVKIMFPANGHHLFSMGTAAMGAARSGDMEERYPFEGASYSQLVFPANVGRGGGRGMSPAAAAASLPRTAMLGWYVPDGPGSHAVYHLDLIDKNANEEQRAAARKMSMLGVAMAIDDQDAWQSMQYAAKGAVARRRTMKYNARETPQQLEHWKGPGEVFAGVSCDDTQWNFWKTWFAAMTADET